MYNRTRNKKTGEEVDLQDSSLGIQRAITDVMFISNCLFPKKDLSLRFWVNYRRLNDRIRQDSSPIPRSGKCIDTLAEVRIFTKLDSNCGYWQVNIAEKCKYNTYFTTHHVLIDSFWLYSVWIIENRIQNVFKKCIFSYSSNDIQNYNYWIILREYDHLKFSLILYPLFVAIILVYHRLS